jgi:putative transposase
VAAGKKNAQRLNASLVFVDESGLLLTPLVRRSWAPRGRTPLLYQRGRSREKVSCIAALSVSPRRRRVGLYFSLRPNANVTIGWIIDFLRHLANHLRRPVVLIWDRLPGHRAGRVQQYLSRRGITAVLLPPYAPELNPVETLWAYLKHNALANWAPPDAVTLARGAQRKADRVKHTPELLRGFLRSTALFCL